MALTRPQPAAHHRKSGLRDAQNRRSVPLSSHAWLLLSLLLVPMPMPAAKDIHKVTLSSGAKTAKSVRDTQVLPETPRVVIVGGGPNLENNQVAIESNVRYVGKLLPPGTTRTTLFADGDPQHATVLYDDSQAPPSSGEKLLDIVLTNEESPSDENTARYRKPNLGAKLDGPSKRASIRQVFAQLRQEYARDPSRPLLLYFTGHGSTNRTSLENNVYDLWGENEEISVRDLAQQIGRLPQETPVTLVMVQCFSGAFGNLIFEGGDPKATTTTRDIAGFFATVKERVAAGCTSAVNEADYHDFTSYFFAALTGRDRLGRRVVGADYNGDGRVGMDEAFCYTLSHDESIDVPVCTSDVFLRHFVTMSDENVFRTPYGRVQTWATPAQKAALTALSDKLKLPSDETRPTVAFDRMTARHETNWGRLAQDAQNSLTSLRKEARQSLVRRFPELRRSRSRARIRQEIIDQLNREITAGQWKDVLNADARVESIYDKAEKEQIADSQIIRFVRLCKSVVLAHQLQQNGSVETKTRFARLTDAEGRTPLPPADMQQNASR